MVVNLNWIMMTANETKDLRKRLRSLETKEDRCLFVTLYKSWSHNAIAALSLCLLAQAYNLACSLLQTL